ncbi:MAG: hypothetical protein ACR2JC_14925 [Chloroflexota bacterium]|nr:MAG: hypothetical protein DLM70_19705 [Chloroflexota bacterium]
MAKKSAKKRDGGPTREEKLRRKVAKAQENFARVQDRRLEIQRKGEEAIEKARAAAQQRLATATFRVEKMATALAGLEERLRRVQPPAPPRTSSREPEHVSAPIKSPEAAADDPQAIEERSARVTDTSLVIPDAPNAPVDTQMRDASKLDGHGSDS